VKKLRLAIRLAWCVLRHDVRQRQHSWHCWTCHPKKKRTKNLRMGAPQ
jgi:hypothetical protein